MTKTPLSRVLWLAALACACDDGAAARAPAPDAAPATDAGGVDRGPPTSCAELCEGYRRACPDALLLQDCAGCAELVAGAAGDDHPQTYARAMALCRRAERVADCRGLAACLSDDDGLTGHATAATISVQGAAFDVSFDLRDDRAVAVLGSKRDGAPSDLVVFFEAEAGVHRVEFDDLGAVRAPRVRAADHPAVLDSLDASLALAEGTVEVTPYTPGGPLRVRAVLNPSERREDVVTVEVEGSWAGQF